MAHEEVPSHEEHWDFEQWEYADTRCPNCREEATQKTGLIREDASGFDARIAWLMKCPTCGKNFTDWEIGWGDEDD